jgi:hypothetical protein
MMTKFSTPAGQHFYLLQLCDDEANGDIQPPDRRLQGVFRLSNDVGCLNAHHFDTNFFNCRGNAVYLRP